MSFTNHDVQTNLVTIWDIVAKKLVTVPHVDAVELVANGSCLDVQPGEE